MSIAGKSLPIVDLSIPLPTVRKDGSDLALAEIQSITILRDAATLSVIAGPFQSATVTFTDASPATGDDLYSYFATDTGGVQGETSAPVSITITGEKPKAPPAASLMKAVAKREPAEDAVPKYAAQQAKKPQESRHDSHGGR